MEEEVSRKTVAISIHAAKLTGPGAVHGVPEVSGRSAETQPGRTHAPRAADRETAHGPRRTVQQYPAKGDARLFDRVARKFNVDYAFHKVGPKDYLLFFKAGQADAITAAFSEYTKRVMARAERPALYPRPAPAVWGAYQTRQKEREKTREAVQER